MALRKAAGGSEPAAAEHQRRNGEPPERVEAGGGEAEAMVVVIDQHSGVPVFRQLKDQIRFQIVSGMLEPGEELPSTRALSAELGLNPMTISKAYSRLEIEGLVEKRPGLPLVVRPLGPEQVETERVEQFQQRARPLAAAARQLGLSREQALRIFAELMDGDGDGVGESGGGRGIAEFDTGKERG